jgi:DNA-binding NtrC family response regulator
LTSGCTLRGTAGTRDAKTDRVGCLEMAESGTLFLDEIANMPLVQQAKLLRVLQTREYQPVGSSRVRRADVRFLAATNVDVAKEVVDGRFRQDLLYRLNTVEIRVPPLRDRREDIAPLVTHFARHYSTQYRQQVCTFTKEAMQVLWTHDWPGNVRELEHVVERALLLAQGPVVDVEDLSLRVTAPAGDARFEQMTLDEVERHLIVRALERSRGQVTEAAKSLGPSRSALYRRLQYHGLKGSE